DPLTPRRRRRCAGAGLAAGAEPQRPRLRPLEPWLAELPARDPGSAAPAGSPAAPVHPQVAVAAQHPAGGGPYGAVRVQHQQAPGEVHDLPEIARGTDGRGGMDAAQEAQLAAVDVADPGEQPLIEQREAQRALR